MIQECNLLENYIISDEIICCMRDDGTNLEIIIQGFTLFGIYHKLLAPFYGAYFDHFQLMIINILWLD